MSNLKTIVIVDNLILESLERYFNTLAKYGYVPYNKTIDLLVLLHINRLQSKDFKEVLSETDNLYLNSVVQCITERNCLVPAINK